MIKHVFCIAKCQADVPYILSAEIFQFYQYKKNYISSIQYYMWAKLEVLGREYVILYWHNIIINYSYCYFF